MNRLCDPRLGPRGGDGLASRRPACRNTVTLWNDIPQTSLLIQHKVWKSSFFMLHSTWKVLMRHIWNFKEAFQTGNSRGVSVFSLQHLNHPPPSWLRVCLRRRQSSSVWSIHRIKLKIKLSLSVYLYISSCIVAGVTADEKTGFVFPSSWMTQSSVYDYFYQTRWIFALKVSFVNISYLCGCKMINDDEQTAVKQEWELKSLNRRAMKRSPIKERRQCLHDCKLEIEIVIYCCNIWAAVWQSSILHPL